MLRNVFVICLVVGRTRPQSMPLALLTMKTELCGFLFLCMQVGLFYGCLAALRAPGAPLLVNVPYLTVKRALRAVKGDGGVGSRSRFMENKLVLSQFTGNKIGISRLTKKKAFFDTNLRNL